MRRLLIIIALSLAPALHAQVVGPGFVNYVTSAPSGACSQSEPQRNVMGAGTIYTCQSGTWAQVSGGGGGVTSFNTRTGAVTSQAGDYGLSLIGNPAGSTTFAYAANQHSTWTFSGTGSFDVTGGPLTLGTDASVAGSMFISNGAGGGAHTILTSAATTTNTIAGFATVPTTGHLLDCTVSSTTCTLHDSAVVTANVVNASSPGVGLAHFAGSTQTVTSSAVDLNSADVTGVLPSANGGNVSVLATGIIMPQVPGVLIGGTASLVAAQNEVDCERTVAPQTITATKVGYRPTASAGTSSHVGFAIYNADGSTRLMTTGAQDGTLAGKITPVTVSSFTLQQGVAYLTCWTDDAATSTTWATYGISITAAVNDGFFNTTSNTTNYVKAANASVAGAPPTTTGALTAITTTTTGIPLLFIQP